VVSERARSGRPPLLGSMDIRAKLICMLAYVLCVVLLPEGQWARFAALGALLGTVAVAARVPSSFLLPRLGLLLPVVVLAAASVWLSPAADAGDAVVVPCTEHEVSRQALARYGSVLAGATLSLICVAVVLYTSGFESLVWGLSRLGVPRVLVALVFLSVRYLDVLADEAKRMVRARDSRGRPPRVATRARVAGAMVGSLFIRSTERAERIGHAMAARGYTGDLPLVRRSSLAAAHVAWATAFCAISAAVTWM